MMKEIADALNRNDDFLLISHINPDGDTIGSAAALAMALAQHDKKAVFAVDGNIPEKLAFLCADICPVGFGECAKRRFGCAIAIDTGDMTRLGRFDGQFAEAAETIVIDHHITNTKFGGHNLIKEYCATGQIICELLAQLDWQIDAAMANALYTAIATDTGNFSYSNTDESCLKTAAMLRGRGADIPMLMQRVYREKSFAATKLIGSAIDSITLHEGGRIAMMTVKQADYKAYGASKEDCDELISYARDIAGVEVAIFLRETENGDVKMSLRSKEYADVAALAQRFGGGGHIHAAGGSIKATLDEACQMTLDAARHII